MAALLRPAASSLRIGCMDGGLGWAVGYRTYSALRAGQGTCAAPRCRALGRALRAASGKEEGSPTELASAGVRGTRLVVRVGDDLK
jgi:hypothetical protein